MPHIHTAPGQIDPTVSAYIIRDDMDEPRLLLHNHRKHNRLLQIGGHIELSETIWGALAHKVEEESGYDFASLEVLQPALRIDTALKQEVVHPVPFYVNTHDVTADGSHFHMDFAYILVAHQAPQRLPREGESQDLRWMSSDDLKACTKEEIYDGVRQTCLTALVEFYKAWQPLPTSHFSTDKPSVSLR